MAGSRLCAEEIMKDHGIPTPSTYKPIQKNASTMLDKKEPIAFRLKYEGWVPVLLYCLLGMALAYGFMTFDREGWAAKISSPRLTASSVENGTREMPTIRGPIITAVDISNRATPTTKGPLITAVDVSHKWWQSGGGDL